MENHDTAGEKPNGEGPNGWGHEPKEEDAPEASETRRLRNRFEKKGV